MKKRATRGRPVKLVTKKEAEASKKRLDGMRRSMTRIGLTHEDAAKRLGVARVSVTRFLSGMPSAGLMKRLPQLLIREAKKQDKQ